jgi:glycerol-3-phosphate cytidylyltransferase
MIAGYTAGVFDLFHIGHVNLLRNARALCDRLVVGVSTDELVFARKRKKPTIPYRDRLEIVRACRYVDAALAQTDVDKFEAWRRLRFDVLFVGDDWFEHESWRTYEQRLGEQGVSTVYLPHTPDVSSTELRSVLKHVRG